MQDIHAWVHHLIVHIQSIPSHSHRPSSPQSESVSHERYTHSQIITRVCSIFVIQRKQAVRLLIFLAFLKNASFDFVGETVGWTLGTSIRGTSRINRLFTLIFQQFKKFASIRNVLSADSKSTVLSVVLLRSSQTKRPRCVTYRSMPRSRVRGAATYAGLTYSTDYSSSAGLCFQTVKPRSRSLPVCAAHSLLSNTARP